MNILLIRLRLIGDVVFTTPIIRALRREFPHARLSYVVEPHAWPVVAGNPHLDEVIVAPPPGSSRGRLRADLRSPAGCARPATTWRSTCTAVRAARSSRG